MVKSICNLLVSILTLLIPARLMAAAPQLVKDINSNPKEIPVSEMLTVGDKAIFEFSTKEHGNELWAKDLITGETKLIKDINPGVRSSSLDLYSAVTLGSKIVFPVYLNDSEVLMATDGTEGGTQALTGSDITYIQQVEAAGSTAFFFANSLTNGRELYLTDGTLAGTRLVKDISAGSVSSNFNEFAASSGKAIFSIYGSANQEIWTSDGTAAGTVKILELSYDFSIDRLSFLGSSGRIILSYYDFDAETFTARAFDGSAWTTIVTSEDLDLRASSSSTLAFVIDYSVTPNRIYKTDGRAVGTASFTTTKAISLYDSVFNSSNQLIAMGDEEDKIFLINGSSNTVSEITPRSGTIDSISRIYRLNSTILVMAAKVGENRKILKLNSLKLDEYFPTNIQFYNDPIANSSSTDLLFISYGTDLNGPPALYKTNGTAAGTLLVKQLASNANEWAEIIGEGQLTSNFLVSVRNYTNGAPATLWRSNGTEAGTISLGSSGLSGLTDDAIFDTSSLVASGNKAFFLAQTGRNSQRKVWITDGSDSGTKEVPATVLGQYFYIESRLINLASENEPPKVAFIAYNYQLSKRFLYTATENEITVAADLSTQLAGSFYISQAEALRNASGNFVLLAAEDSDCDLYSINLANGAAKLLADDFSPSCWGSIEVGADKSFAAIIAEGNGLDVLLTDGNSIVTRPLGSSSIGAAYYDSAIVSDAGGAKCLFMSVSSADGQTALLRMAPDGSAEMMTPFSNESYSLIESADKDGNVILWKDISNSGHIAFSSVNCSSQSLSQIGSLTFDWNFSYEADRGEVVMVNTVNGITKLYTIDAQSITELQTIVDGEDAYIESSAHVNGLSIFKISLTGGVMEFWRTDKTAAGTYSLGKVGSGYNDLYSPIVALPSKALFSANDLVTGAELWMIDFDLCPGDPSKIQPGSCGCGIPDTDSDLDGALDCSDSCSIDPAKTAPGLCGCGVPDSDIDLDGALDCNDSCSSDADKVEPGSCGCGIPDEDLNFDGVIDCLEESITEKTPQKPSVKKSVNKKSKKVSYVTNLPTKAEAYKITVRNMSNKKAKPKVVKTSKNPYTLGKISKGSYGISYTICTADFISCSKPSAEAKFKIK